MLRFADFELDRGAHELRPGGRVVRLERIPFDLLVLLAQRLGQPARATRPFFWSASPNRRSLVFALPTTEQIEIAAEGPQWSSGRRGRKLSELIGFRCRQRLVRANGG